MGYDVYEAILARSPYPGGVYIEGQYDTGWYAIARFPDRATCECARASIPHSHVYFTADGSSVFATRGARLGDVLISPLEHPA